jgi:tetratricopeptide (TPR) repeat protein
MFSPRWNLPNTLTDEHRFGEAETLQRAALNGRIRVLVADNPDTLFAMCNLANVFAGEGKYKEAEALYRKALAGEARVLGPNHPEIGNVWYNLARMAAVQGQRTSAFESLRQAIDHGYAYPDEIASDDNWKSLRNDPRYYSLFAEVRQKSEGQKH